MCREGHMIVGIPERIRYDRMYMSNIDGWITPIKLLSAGCSNILLRTTL